MARAMFYSWYEVREIHRDGSFEILPCQNDPDETEFDTYEEAAEVWRSYKDNGYRDIHVVLLTANIQPDPRIRRS